MEIIENAVKRSLYLLFLFYIFKKFYKDMVIVVISSSYKFNLFKSPMATQVLTLFYNIYLFNFF